VRQAENNSKYFNGLNALRFFAASLVVLHHIEETRHHAGLYSFSGLDFFKNGGTAVSFFFVLSGFLIAFVLKNEIGKTGSVNLKTFYIKRSFRIWPLYFVLIFIGFVLLPLILQGEQYASKFPYLNLKGALLYILFLPNLASGLWRGHFLIPLWSIGVEEQFYLIFAPLVNWFKNKLVWLFALIIVVKLLIALFLFPHIESSAYRIFANSIKFENMAVGGLLMLVLTKPKSSISQILTNKVTQVLAVLYILFTLFYHIELPSIVTNEYTPQHFLFNISQAIAFAILIFNVCKEDSSLIQLSNKFLSRLGEISYGIYMYHMLFVFAGIEVMKKLELTGGAVSTAFIYLFVFGATIVTAQLSFRFIEKPIIGLKKRLS
jgi:peptidoglycan/LPS O-acetylase OafA/YrhL